MIFNGSLPMDDSERTTDETEGLGRNDVWVMPEPVFRSTPGRRPGEKRDPQIDIETEPVGFAQTTETAAQTVRAKEERPHRHKKKKGGCARFFTLLAVLIGLAIGSVVVALVYFLFYYRPSSTIF